ncbi:MAG TPA: hypothetical protein V6C85_17860 [Allocoleopsis sp.]
MSNFLVDACGCDRSHFPHVPKGYNLSDARLTNACDRTNHSTSALSYIKEQ